ncbi:MAG: Glyoxalase/bleomycin resistance protein/dioxygenase, partial [Caulobacter sp.]|nr:Glyoxalase/bleomycin resistance protein/dioxygenase [Caulobacter sp.]
AGLMTLPGGGPPLWVGYILVDDVDAYAQRLTEAGGVVHHPPDDIPGVGRFAMVADPQGAVFVLFKGLPSLAPAPAGPGPGLVGWRELVAVDGEAALAFYAGLFGWTPTERFDMGPMGPYQLFATGGGDAVGGVMTKPPGVPAPFWSYYFEVDGVQAAIKRLQAGGGTVINGPHQVPGDAWVAQAIDPQGAMFSLTSRQA